MADTHVAPRPDADDAADPPAAYDVPWRFDVPQLRTLRVVRRQLPADQTADLPDGVLTMPAARRGLGLGRRRRLSTRSRLGLVAVVSAALGLLDSVSGVGPHAGAQNPVGDITLLDARQWQAAAPASTDWEAGTVYLGRRDPELSCVTAPLPVDRTAHRRSTGATALGVQHVTRAADARAAETLMAGYLANLGACVAQRAAANGDTVRIRTLGTHGTADALVVLGAFVRGDNPRTTLFGVGRDGRLFTAMELHVLGARADAPIEQFTAVAKRGVGQLR